MAPQYFLRTTYIHNKYMYTIGAYYLQYCGSYALYRQRRTPDAARWMLDAGRWTMDDGRWTQDPQPYYKLTGELKTTFSAIISLIFNGFCSNFQLFCLSRRPKFLRSLKTLSSKIKIPSI